MKGNTILILLRLVVVVFLTSRWSTSAFSPEMAQTCRPSSTDMADRPFLLSMNLRAAKIGHPRHFHRFGVLRSHTSGDDVNKCQSHEQTSRPIFNKMMTSVSDEFANVCNMMTLSSLIMIISIFTFILPMATWADEIGVEKDAPTLYTGEIVEICTKRGPLGACLKTEFRTEENDNDKASKYFKYSSKALKERNEVLSGVDSDTGESNALILRLQQQTEENREKNKLDVERRTFENDQSATFGPFDRQVVIMNTDGKTFTLLQNPQAMRLKKAGFIEDRKFVKQPTAEELAQALEPDEGGEGLAGAIQGIFGNK